MIHRPLYNVKPIKNLKDMVEQSTRLYGKKAAFLIKTNENNYKEIKYTDFKNDINAFGTALINLGLKSKFIAVIGENRYEWCVTYLATVNGTGIIVPLDKELPFSEIENLLVRSKASAVIFSGKHEKEMRQLAATLSSVKYFINMDLEQDDQTFLSYNQLIIKGKELVDSGNRTFIDAQIDEESMNMLIFTSGTTDLAKGVMLSHKNICSNMMAICSTLYIDSNDSALSILPIHHTYECTAGFLVMVYNGCTITFNESLKHIVKNLKEIKPTLLILVPLIIENMYKKIWEQAGKKPGMKILLKALIVISDFLFNILRIDIRRKLFKQVHENIGGRVRLIISGAAAIDPRVIKGFRSMGITVIQGYGLTECSPIVAVNREKVIRDDSIGQPLPGVEVMVDNPNNEGIGELLVKGDNVMLGYFENSLATEKVLKNGWLYTGDLGKADSMDFFIITGRKKNVIVTKNGKNIYPEEVEAYLNKSPLIMESLVWGKYDPETDDTYINAQIVPDLESMKERLKLSDISQEEIFRLINNEVRNVNRSMPLYKRIHEFSIRENEFAKTTTRKIKRYIEKTG